MTSLSSFSFFFQNKRKKDDFSFYLYFVYCWHNNVIQYIITYRPIEENDIKSVYRMKVLGICYIKYYIMCNSKYNSYIIM